MYHYGVHYGQLPTLYVNNSEAVIIYCKQKYAFMNNVKRNNPGILDLFPCSLGKTSLDECKQCPITLCMLRVMIML